MSSCATCARVVLDSFGTDQNSSRQRTNLLPLSVVDSGSRFGARRFGLPRDMPNIHAMFEGGDAAIVGNVGPLLEPTDRTSFETNRVALPSQLFSHNDQQSTWMSLRAEGARFGWGGAIADCAVGAGAGGTDGLYASIASKTPDVFLAGRQARPFRIPNLGSASVLRTSRIRRYIGNRSEKNDVREAIAAFMTRDAAEHTNPFRQDVSGAMARGVAQQGAYSELLQTASLDTTTFPASSLGKQLAAIALSMSIREETGAQRQVFYADFGGFDTHANHGDDIPGLQSQLDQAVGAFRNSMVAQGLWNDVLVITMSDFGRSLIGNGAGTDHGWGGHSFVMGGAVSGRRVFGDIPPPDPAHAQYTARRARMIPTTSVEQFAAPIASWFGLTPDEVSSIFPHLSRFPSGTMDYI